MESLDDLIRDVDTILERGEDIGRLSPSKIVQEIYEVQYRYIELLCPGYRNLLKQYIHLDKWPSYSEYTGIFYVLRYMIENCRLEFVVTFAKTLYSEYDKYLDNLHIENPETFQPAEFRDTLKRFLDLTRDFVLYHHKPRIKPSPGK